MSIAEQEMLLGSFIEFAFTSSHVDASIARDRRSGLSGCAFLDPGLDQAPPLAAPAALNESELPSENAWSHRLSVDQ